MPADRSTLLALAERAEAGGDDRLSDDVWIALGWTRGEYQGWITPDRSCHHMSPRRDLCRSIDAQEAVPGRMLHVTRVEANSQWLEHWAASVAKSDGWVAGLAPTEPLARLSAKLRALAAATPEEGT